MKPIFVLFGEKIHDMVEYKAIFGLGIPPKIGGQKRTKLSHWMPNNYLCN